LRSTGNQPRLWNAIHHCRRVRDSRKNDTFNGCYLYSDTLPSHGTGVYFHQPIPKGAMERNFPEIDKTLSRERIWAYFGLVLTVTVFLLTWCILQPSA